MASPGLPGRHRTMVLRRPQGRSTRTPSRAGMGVAWGVRMKHAHNIGSLSCQTERKMRTRPRPESSSQCVPAETYPVRG